MTLPESLMYPLIVAAFVLPAVAIIQGGLGWVLASLVVGLVAVVELVADL